MTAEQILKEINCHHCGRPKAAAVQDDSIVIFCNSICLQNWKRGRPPAEDVLNSTEFREQRDNPDQNDDETRDDVMV